MDAVALIVVVTLGILLLMQIRRCARYVEGPKEPAHRTGPEMPLYNPWWKS